MISREPGGGEEEDEMVERKRKCRVLVEAESQMESNRSNGWTEYPYSKVRWETSPITRRPAR